MGVTHSLANHTQHTSGYFPPKSAGKINNLLKVVTGRQNICDNLQKEIQFKMSSRDSQCPVISSSSTTSEVSSTSESVSSSSLSQTLVDSSCSPTEVSSSFSSEVSSCNLSSSFHNN